MVSAPALIIGLRGRPEPRSKESSLNASPEGSTPTLDRIGAEPWSAIASA